MKDSRFEVLEFFFKEKLRIPRIAILEVDKILDSYQKDGFELGLLRKDTFKYYIEQFISDEIIVMSTEKTFYIPTEKAQEIYDTGSFEKYYKNKDTKEYKRTLFATFCGVALGAILTGLLQYCQGYSQDQLQTKTIVCPKVQMVHDTAMIHDTIYLNDSTKK